MPPLHNFSESFDKIYIKREHRTCLPGTGIHRLGKFCMNFENNTKIVASYESGSYDYIKRIFKRLLPSYGRGSVQLNYCKENIIKLKQ